MIKTRLVGLLSHAKKYIVYTILWQWAALLSQVLAVFSIADLLEKVVYHSVTTAAVERTVLTLILVDRIINNMVVEQVLNELDEIERNIIIMRYFQDKTQSEIAKKLGISQVQVSRMEKKILFNLRKKILA